MTMQTHTLARTMDAFDFIDFGLRVRVEVEPGQGIELVVERASRYASMVWGKMGPAAEVPDLTVDPRVLLMSIGDDGDEVHIPVHAHEVKVTHTPAGTVLLVGFKVLPGLRRPPSVRLRAWSATAG